MKATILVSTVLLLIAGVGIATADPSPAPSVMPEAPAVEPDAQIPETEPLAPEATDIELELDVSEKINCGQVHCLTERMDCYDYCIQTSGGQSCRWNCDDAYLLCIS